MSLGLLDFRRFWPVRRFLDSAFLGFMNCFVLLLLRLLLLYCFWDFVRRRYSNGLVGVIQNFKVRLVWDLELEFGDFRVSGIRGYGFRKWGGAHSLLGFRFWVMLLW